VGLAVFCLGCSDSGKPNPQDAAAAGKEASVSDAQAVKDKGVVDAVNPAWKPFACGSSGTCQPGEYCRLYPTHKTPPTWHDGGPECPQDCSLGLSECICASFTCHPMGAGCGTCSCMTLDKCSCSEGKDGSIYLTCANPWL